MEASSIPASSAAARLASTASCSGVFPEARVSGVYPTPEMEAFGPNITHPRLLVRQLYDSCRYWNCMAFLVNNHAVSSLAGTVCKDLSSSTDPCGTGAYLKARTQR